MPTLNHQTEGKVLRSGLHKVAMLPPVDSWQHFNNTGNKLKAAGRLAEAEANYARAARMAPLAFEPHYNRGLAFIDAGRLSEAEASLRRALVLDPTHGMAHLNLGNVYQSVQRMNEAELHYVEAQAKLPEEPRLFNNLGRLYFKQKRYAEAERCYREAIRLDERCDMALTNLGELMAAHGQLEPAVTLMREAVKLDTGRAQLHSNLLFTLCHVPGITAGELFAEHRRFAERIERPLLTEWTEHTNSRDTERELRVGFVSADLNDHPVMRYLLPALRELRARGEFRLVAYNNSLKADAVTGAYQRLFHEWRGVHHLTDEALASQVRTDGIDILFDLSGHTGYNRMLTFARRPAPVQVSWIGYPATTGMEAMDYFVADHFLVSAEMRQQFSERILDVPATTNFEPLAVAPEVNALPALTNGYVTFASLARTNKMNRPVVAAWAEILRRAPTARLMLATMANGEPPAAVQEWFAAQGIAGERLEFVHPRSVEEVLALHHRIDMALDTFPYNGSTGNAHALWMGVPTVALEGGTAPGRMGSGLARHAGLDEFVAADVEGYIRRAVEWAERPSKLAEIRAEAREAFRKSALMQTRATVRVLSAKLREAWRRWCRGLAAESF